ncbi:hypothetical protein J7E62_02490 [Variovorax paradoxus]|nr:hypothetical protein [Variovorax paradoxus]
MSAGHAGVLWDSQGQIHAYADHDAEGGGASALRTMEQLLEGIQHELAQAKDARGQPLYGLVQLQRRYCDGKGERADGSGDTLAGDFVRHMAEGGAIVPQ